MLAECLCTHDSDLHSLEDVEFVTLPGEENRYVRFKWRFSCVGRMHGLPCSCNNLQPIEARKEVQ